MKKPRCTDLRIFPRRNNNPPDPLGRILKSQKNEFFSRFSFYQNGTGINHRLIKHKRIRSVKTALKINHSRALSARCLYEQVVTVQAAIPHFHTESRNTLCYTHLYLLGNRTHVMMPLIPLISTAYDNCPASFIGNRIQVNAKRRASRMIAQIGSQTKHDHHRTLKYNGHLFQIFDCFHDIIFLIGNSILRDQIIISQILLCLLQLDNCNIRLRCGAT